MPSLMDCDPGLDLARSERANEEAWRAALDELHSAQAHLARFFGLADSRLAIRNTFAPDCLVLQRIREEVAASSRAIVAQIPTLEMHLMFRYEAPERPADYERETPACIGCGMAPEGPLNQVAEEVGVV